MSHGPFGRISAVPSDRAGSLLRRSAYDPSHAPNPLGLSRWEMTGRQVMLSSAGIEERGLPKNISRY